MKIEHKYNINNPPGRLDRRVFIGGNYSFSIQLTEIAESVEDGDFQPILVWEFGVIPGTERHSSESILKQCKYAIFEVSSDAGYMYEIDDAQKYSLITLCLWAENRDGTPRISAMTRSHPVFQRNQRPYKSNRTLHYEVLNFLKSQP